MESPVGQTLSFFIKGSTNLTILNAPDSQLQVSPVHSALQPSTIW